MILMMVSSTGIVACASQAPPAPSPPQLEVSSFGEDRGQGNLLSLELWADPLVYATEERLTQRVAAMLERAAQEGFLNERTIAVLPEYTGTWLVTLDEEAGVYSAETTSDAMLPVALGDLPAFLGNRFGSPAEDVDTYGIFAMKAERMASAYQRIFSGLAKRFEITLVAGSILLPAPTLDEGVIQVEEGGELFNASFVFGPDGEVLGDPVRKVFPTKDEQAFVAAGQARDLPVFETKAGPLGVLVCADAWYPQTVNALAEGGAEIIAVPQYVTGKGIWNEKWGGYSGHSAPGDVDLDDVDTITEADAWRRYAFGRLKTIEPRAIAIVPLRGELWDLGTDGEGLLFSQGDEEETALANTPKVSNLWL
jgi:predicted amidohydrolase